MEKFDVIIIGGGTAGLSAALTLGRSRKRTLVCGSGAPRNAPSHQAYNFFTRDGIDPIELLSIGREQLAPYNSVRFQPEAVIDACKKDNGFEVTLESGTQVGARRLLLATGVIDELPVIAGLQELWGISALHCPYCHGWEVQDQAIALYGSGQVGFDLCVLIKGWSNDLVLCTDGPADLTDEQRALLDRHNIPVREEKIDRFEGKDGHLHTIVFVDGSVLARTAMYLRAPQRQRSELPKLLGCAIENGFVKVDDLGQTSIPGVNAAGDMITPMQSLPFATFSGMGAGVVLNHGLLAEDFDSASH
jgi:thioredoxin reductase